MKKVHTHYKYLDHYQYLVPSQEVYNKVMKLYDSVEIIDLPLPFVDWRMPIWDLKAMHEDVRLPKFLLNNGIDILSDIIEAKQ